tara:strand:- start:7871 stop:8146 length:276 start_codon:yes stop_codon:yes gene_type:complete
MSLKSKMVKPSEKRKLIKELKITETDIEFLLTAIKNSMIHGSTLEQAVATIEKLQNIYTQLQASSEQSGSTPGQIAARKAQKELEEKENEK